MDSAEVSSRYEKWIGVDFDGTLCFDDGSGDYGLAIKGDPIPAMVDRIHKWTSLGIKVRIVTARLSKEHGDYATAIASIRTWLIKHLGYELPIQIEKSAGMIELWDDKAVAVEKNTGRRLSPSKAEFIS